MSSRTAAFSALALAAAATLGCQVLSYGLVYPSSSLGQKWPLALALLAGSLFATGAGWVSLRALRQSSLQSERFVALLALLVSAFFLFIVLVGFGIPDLVLGLRD